MRESSGVSGSRIEERLRAVRERIERAACAAGRDPQSVRLLAVSKYQPAAAVRAAYAAGQRDFGENYVQELGAKQSQLAGLPELRFHFIGQLQRNKARRVAELASTVHSVDSCKLVEALGRAARARESPLGVFIQVNVSDEAQKGGCREAELERLLVAVGGQAALRLMGLMAVPQAGLSCGSLAAQFGRVAGLRQAHGGSQRLPELSMGMSQDLEAAIAAGSTCVRIGTAIFGARASVG